MEEDLKEKNMEKKKKRWDELGWVGAVRNTMKEKGITEWRYREFENEW